MLLQRLPACPDKAPSPRGPARRGRRPPSTWMRPRLCICEAWAPVPGTWTVNGEDAPPRALAVLAEMPVGPHAHRGSEGQVAALRQCCQPGSNQAVPLTRGSVSEREADPIVVLRGPWSEHVSDLRSPADPGAPRLRAAGPGLPPGRTHVLGKSPAAQPHRISFGRGGGVLALRASARCRASGPVHPPTAEGAAGRPH